MNENNSINYKERAALLKKHIIECNDFPVEEVKVPEWNLPFPVYVKTMSAKERDAFESRQMVEGAEGEGRKFSLENLRASMLVAVLCADPEGKYPIFDEKDDVLELGKKSSAAIDRCLDVARKLNGSTKEDEENLVKNSIGQDENSG
jgi:hypothetical protein